MAVQEISRDRQFRTDREAGLPYVDFLESPWAGWGPSANTGGNAKYWSSDRAENSPRPTSGAALAP